MLKHLYFIYICICLIGQRIFVLCQFLFSFWCFHNSKVLTLLFLGNCMKQVSEKMFWNSPRKYFFNMSDCTFLIAYYWLNSWNTRGYLTSKVRTPKLCYIHIYHIIKNTKGILILLEYIFPLKSRQVTAAARWKTKYKALRVNRLLTPVLIHI